MYDKRGHSKQIKWIDHRDRKILYSVLCVLGTTLRTAGSITLL